MSERLSPTAVKCSPVTYHFQTSQDADGFEKCIKDGGRPGSCAQQHRCIRKEEPQRDRGLER